MSLEIKHSRRARRITIRVLPGHVIVTAPAGTPEQLIASVTKEKSLWIKQKLAIYAQADLSLCPDRFRDGAVFSLLGRKVSLKLISDSCGFQLRGNSVISSEHTFSEPALRAWLDKVLMQELISMSEGFCSALGKRPSRTRLGNARTRWGSCSHAGTVMINRKLVHAPRSVVAYVLAHELVHLVHRNHSKDFWRELEGLKVNIPDSKKWLRTSGMWLLAQ